MSNITNPLIVPIRVDAVYANGNEDLSGSTLDLTKLKGDTKWLSETSTVYQDPLDHHAQLEKGIHLHWTLPKALTAGTTVYVLDYNVYNELLMQGLPDALLKALQNKAGLDGSERTLEQMKDLLGLLLDGALHPPADVLTTSTTLTSAVSSSDKLNKSYTHYLPTDLCWDDISLAIYTPLILKTSARMKMPPVPNRWLVIRELTGAEGHEKAWVVESDWQGEESTDNSYATYTKILKKMECDSKGAAQTNSKNYLCLGRTIDAHLHPELISSQYEDPFPLTAIGSGLPDFAAFYPNCKGVFGFHDTETLDPDGQYTYTIIGWFDNPQNDPLSSAYAVSPWAQTDVTPDTKLQRLGWALSNGTDIHTIDGTVYAAKIRITPNSCACEVTEPSNNDIIIAIGNTSAEALSALLANGQQDTVSNLTIESMLNALQSGILHNAHEADGAAVIENMLHQQAFQSEPGGLIWEIVPSENTPTVSAVSPEIAHALNDLNQAQRIFDNTQAYIKEQRKLGFCDWYWSEHYLEELQKTNNTSGSFGDSIPSLEAAIFGDGTQKPFVYKVYQNLYNAHQSLSEKISSTTYVLKKKPAPRFWRPNDPNVLLKKAETAQTNWLEATDYGADAPYKKFETDPVLLSPRIGDVKNYIPEFSRISQEILSHIAAAISDYSMTTNWRPLMLTWSAEYTSLVKDKSAPNTYSQNFLAQSSIFKMDEAEIDYKHRDTADSNFGAHTINSAISGRTLLSSHTTKAMKDRIRTLLNISSTEELNRDNIAQHLPTWLQKDEVLITDILADCNASLITLSQTLSGFHDNFLMLRHRPQLPVYSTTMTSNADANGNKLWNPDLQSYSNEIGLQNAFSPIYQEAAIYEPIRAGAFVLDTVKIVDRFGRKITVYGKGNQNTIINSIQLHQLPLANSNDYQRFVLPPRLSQPARLLFRWSASDVTMATDSGLMEMNSHPASSPICGWIALNRVDATILVFEQDGTLLGWIDDQKGWNSAPGNVCGDVTDIQHPLLKQAVASLQTTYPFENIDMALLTIEPRAHQQHTARSVLVSRPLAIVHAAFKLELRGNVPAPIQNANSATTNITQNTSTYSPLSGTTSPFPARETYGFEKVNFPVRLGNVSMDDDGLVGYWLGSDLNTLKWASNEPTENVTCDPAADPTAVVLLMDPRASIHLTSGILPTKKINIPPDMYADALKNMELIMEAGPILSPAEQLTLPLPTEVKGQWHWVDEDNTILHDISGKVYDISGKVDDRAHLSPKPPVYREGKLLVKYDKGE